MQKLTLDATVENVAKAGGLGIYIVKKMVDSMSYEYKDKKTIEHFSSPEQMNDYIKVSTPGIWMVLVSQASNASIAGDLVNTVAPLFLNTGMLVFYFAVMIRYSVPLAMIGLAATLINLGVSRFIAAKRINITRVLMRDQAKLADATVSGIEMIETIKASGAEKRIL